MVCLIEGQCLQLQVHHQRARRSNALSLLPRTFHTTGFVILGLICELYSQNISRLSVASVHIGENYILKHCKHGQFIFNEKDTYIGRSLNLYGEWCETELSIFLKYIDPGDVVVDVGANIGVFTVPLAKAIGINGHVIAFEPQKPIYQLLQSNLVINDLKQVTSFQFAVGKDNGSAFVPVVKYHVEGNFGAMSLLPSENWEKRGNHYQVQVVTLDDIVLHAPVSTLNLPQTHEARCPSFMKIDAEGMDYDVLLGSQQLLKECIPVIYIEANHVCVSKKIIQLLHFYNYQLFWVISSYFNKNNYFGNDLDVFGFSTLSYNILAVPFTKEKGLKVSSAPREFVRIRPDNSGYYLHQYILKFDGVPVILKQQGNAAKCQDS